MARSLAELVEDWPLLALRAVTDDDDDLAYPHAFQLWCSPLPDDAGASPYPAFGPCVLVQELFGSIDGLGGAVDDCPALALVETHGSAALGAIHGAARLALVCPASLVAWALPGEVRVPGVPAFGLDVLFN